MCSVKLKAPELENVATNFKSVSKTVADDEVLKVKKKSDEFRPRIVEVTLFFSLSVLFDVSILKRTLSLVT